MKIALLVPDPLSAEYAPYAEPSRDRYRTLFRDIGVETVAVPWRDQPPSGLDGAIPMLAWGYHLDPPAWLEAIERWAAAAPLVNAAPVLRWNTRKTYLADLSRAGVPIVPTVFAALADGPALSAAARELGTEDLVLKPQVSAGGHRTVRLRPGEALAEDLPDAMIQPFLPEVAGDGELSLFFFAGQFSHAVRKVAAPGEFRVQPHYGGRLTRFEPGTEVLAAALHALRAAPHPPTYARIDLVRGADGRLLLMELEAIEPDLYLGLAPEGGRAWARAVVECMV